MVRRATGAAGLMCDGGCERRIGRAAAGRSGGAAQSATSTCAVCDGCGGWGKGCGGGEVDEARKGESASE